MEDKLLSDHLLDALAALNRARETITHGNVERHREAVLHELTSAELSVSRVIHLISGEVR